MEVMNFRPRKIVLVFWLIGATFTSLSLGGLLAAISFDSSCEFSEFSPWIGFVIGFLPVWFISSLCFTLRFYSIKYILDDRYISKSCGVIWKKKRSIPLEKITNIDVRQGPLERLFGFGQIWIFTPSTGAATPEEKLIGISAPHEMKEVIIQRSESPKGNNISTPTVSSSQSTDLNNNLLEDIKGALLRIEELLKNSNKAA